MGNDNLTMGGTIRDFPGKSPRPFRRLSSMWVALAGIALVGILGAVVFYVQHKPTPIAIVATPPLPREAPPPRPAFTAAEEAYIRGLGPIHVSVEHATLRLTLGQIFYLNRDLDQAELKRRVEQATAAYRDAEKRLRTLEPPASLQSRHNEYLAAVRLFQTSTAEVRKMFQDGREENHLRAAYPLAQEGTDKIREIGHHFWPGEHPAH